NLDQDDPVPPSYQVKGIGDFNGDGYSDILWRAGNGPVGYWYLRSNVVIGGVESGGQDVNHEWEIQGVGDFDADGRSDILWRSNLSGRLVLWFRGLIDYQGSPTWQNWPGAVVGQEWQVQGVGDFNADGRSDIVWRSSWGAVSIWLMNGAWYIG